ncbi:MAG: cell division protein FtsL [Pseudomonadales bacterium]|nr:cell division protein FtsL [Pseudomonadales bacterium]
MIEGGPLVGLFSWLLSIRQLGVGVLFALVLVCSMAVSFFSHQARQYYIQLQSIDTQRDNLDSEYEKLLLEQGAWADFSRVDRVSRTKLGMHPPMAENMVIMVLEK